MGHGLWVSMDGFVVGIGELRLMAICELHWVAMSLLNF